MGRKSPAWWPGAPKEPPANTSPEAVKLRQAALAFANQLPSHDLHDRVGMKVNRTLLRAAFAYVQVAGVEEPDEGEGVEAKIQRRQNKTVQFNVRLTSSQIKKLKHYAWKQGPGVRASDVVRHLIDGLSEVGGKVDL